MTNTTRAAAAEYAFLLATDGDADLEHALRFVREFVRSPTSDGLFHPDNYTNAPAEVRTKMVEAYRLVSESRPDA